MSIGEPQEQPAGFARPRHWKPLRAMGPAGEVGEPPTSFQWLPLGRAAVIMHEPAQAAAVRDQPAEVRSFPLCLADVLDVGPAAAVTAEIEEDQRRYPVAEAEGDPSKRTVLGRVAPCA